MRYHLEFLTLGPHLELSVRCPGSLFCIRYSPENIKASSLRGKYERSSDDYAERGDMSAANQLIEPFASQMARLASPDQGYLLSDYLYPRYFVLQAAAGSTDTEITPQPEKKERTLPGDYMHQWPELAGLTDWVKIYSSKDIRLPPEEDTRLSGPEKVLVNGESFFFKIWRQSALPPGANLTELRTFKQIQEGL